MAVNIGKPKPRSARSRHSAHFLVARNRMGPLLDSLISPVGLPPLTPPSLSSRCRCRTARPGAGLRCRGAGGCDRLSSEDDAACPPALLLGVLASPSAGL